MKLYPDLMRHVLGNGTSKADRTGTRSVFGWQIRFDLGIFARVYGHQWRHWKTPDGRKIDQLIDGLKKIPTRAGIWSPPGIRAMSSARRYHPAAPSFSNMLLPPRQGSGSAVETLLPALPEALTFSLAYQSFATFIKLSL